MMLDFCLPIVIGFQGGRVVNATGEMPAVEVLFLGWPLHLADLPL